MTPPVTLQRMTADEFYDFVHRPENLGRSFELVRGEVVEVSRPGEVHGVVCGNLAFLLGAYVRQARRGNVVCNDTGVILERNPDTVRGPDIAYFSPPRPFPELNPKFSEHTPVLVVEVWSPNDRPGKAARRIADYLRVGVKAVWVVYPEEGEVTVYRSGAIPETLERTQELDGGDALPGFRCAVADFFFSPDAPAEGDPEPTSPPP